MENRRPGFKCDIQDGLCCIFLELNPSVIFQLQLLTTWGDLYYIGLNGLEFYDQNHERISLSDNSILSYEFTSTFMPSYIDLQDSYSGRRHSVDSNSICYEDAAVTNGQRFL